MLIKHSVTYHYYQKINHYIPSVSLQTTRYSWRTLLYVFLVVFDYCLEWRRNPRWRTNYASSDWKFDKHTRIDTLYQRQRLCFTFHFLMKFDYSFLYLHPKHVVRSIRDFNDNFNILSWHSELSEIYFPKYTSKCFDITRKNRYYALQLRWLQWTQMSEIIQNYLQVIQDIYFTAEK